MKRKRQIIILVVIILLSVSITGVRPSSSKSAKVVDMSSITLPYYPFPKGYITKKQAMEIAVKAAEWHLHKGEKLRNIQCLFLPYSVGYGILYNDSQDLKIGFTIPDGKSPSKEDLKKMRRKYNEPDAKSMYFIIMDVNRYPGEAFMHLPPNPGFKIRLINGKYITTQDTYVIDAQTGKFT